MCRHDDEDDGDDHRTVPGTVQTVAVNLRGGSLPCCFGRPVLPARF